MEGGEVKARLPVVPRTVTLYCATVWLASSVAEAGPGWKFDATPPIDRAPASSPAVTLLTRSKVGWSFTAFTVIVKVRGVLVLTLGDVPSPLSVAVTLIVAVPFVSGAVVKVSLPAASMDGAEVNA